MWSLTKKLSPVAVAVCLVSMVACSGGDDEASPTGPEGGSSNYRADMRTFVQSISSYAKGMKSNFAIIPQNGSELITTDGEPDGPISTAYAGAIDGHGREDLLYGYIDDNIPTPTDDAAWLQSFCDLCEQYGISVMVTDYAWNQTYMADSYTKNAQKGYISFAADSRDLNDIPSYPAGPYNENAANITSLSQAKNFLYMINPDQFATKTAMINALKATNYDVILLDLFFDSDALTAADLAQFRTKANGGSRLLIAYMSIGEAENYRYYWQSSWSSNPPAWLAASNPAWPNNYKVRYWDSDWQAIIFGSDTSYLKKIIDAGFDGVYLDLIEAYEYFETGNQ